MALPQTLLDAMLTCSLALQNADVLGGCLILNLNQQGEWMVSPYSSVQPGYDTVVEKH